MFCSKCDKENVKGSKFCSWCGNSILEEKTIEQKQERAVQSGSLRKILGSVLAILSFLVPVAFPGGILGILLGVAAATWCLKHYGVVSPNSMWVSETEGVKKAKYILLTATVVIIVVVGAYIIYFQ